MKILWVLTALSALLGMFSMLLSFTMGGVSQAAGFAAACAFAVVPYVFTRAIEAISGASLNDAVEKLSDISAKLNVK